MNINYYYPIERIHVLSKNYENMVCEELKSFIETYNKIVIKTPESNHMNRKNYFWRKKCKFNSKDFEKYLKNKWSPNLPKNDREKIQRLVISHLNKLNDKKFTIITKELLDSLETLMYFETYEILINELLEKVKNDKQYVKIYSRLVNELYINKKWQKRIILLTNTEEGIYWSVNKLDIEESDREFIGPFETERDAYTDALKNYSFDKEIINKVNNIFKNRSTFIQELDKNKNDFDLYLLCKNNYINFIEFIYYLCNYNFLPEDILLHVLIQFLNNYQENNKIIELELFCHLYTLYKNSNSLRILSSNHLFFESRIKNILNNNSVDLKIKFIIQNIFKIEEDQIKINRYMTLLDIEQSDNQSEEEEKDVYENIKCMINEYPMHLSSEPVLEMLEIIEEKYNKKISEEIIDELLIGNNGNFESILELLKIIKTNNRIEDGDNILKKYKDEIDEYEIDFPNIKENIEKIDQVIKNE